MHQKIDSSSGIYFSHSFLRIVPVTRTVGWTASPGWCPDIVIGRTVTLFCARKIEEMNKFEASTIFICVKYSLTHKNKSLTAKSHSLFGSRWHKLPYEILLVNECEQPIDFCTKAWHFSMEKVTDIHRTLKTTRVSPPEAGAQFYDLREKNIHPVNFRYRVVLATIWSTESLCIVIKDSKLYS